MRCLTIAKWKFSLILTNTKWKFVIINCNLTKINVVISEMNVKIQ